GAAASRAAGGGGRIAETPPAAAGDHSRPARGRGRTPLGGVRGGGLAALAPGGTRAGRPAGRPVARGGRRHRDAGRGRRPAARGARRVRPGSGRGRRRPRPARRRAAAPVPGRSRMKIVDAEVIVSCPGRNYVTLKLVTDDGVAGYGDATLNGRELAVAAYLREHVCPLLIGRDATRINATWQYL